METFFNANEKIELKGIDGQYIIKEIFGRGSSCVVYLTEFINKNGISSEHLLKEFNPRRIPLVRDESKYLTLKSPNYEKSFNDAKIRFAKGYEKQLKLLKEPELKNYTANINNIYPDYGTVYIDMTATAGQSYADVKEKSIFDLARRIKVLTQVISSYHKFGYLHLDIKPNNIFVRPENETCESLILFDCDSLIEKNDVENIEDFSYTLEWAPIELTARKGQYPISESTDIFSIGEIFFEKLMGRHSESWERCTTSEYDYDFNSPIFKNANPKIIPLLDELFHHTICNNPDNRYQKADELVEVLDRIIKISNPDEPYLLSSCPKPQEFFVGRESELVDIYNKLKENQVLFLSGMGGIGKSELAKNYAKIYKDCYDTIIFAPYVTDFKAIMSNDNSIPIYNVFKYPAESFEDYSARKLRKFKELCDDKTLLIVDNFNTSEDSLFQEILNLNCHILFTTRVDFSDFNYNLLEINSITDKSKVFDIFNRYYTKPLSNEEQACVEKIIDITFGHTMTVELLAKQMMAGRIKPQKMLETLQSNGISESGKEKVSSSKDNKLERMSAFDHIQALFDLSNLNEQEIYILANLSLMPYTGISTELFCEWCEIQSYDTINTLVIEGWIKLYKEKDVISLHPIIAEILYSKNILQSASRLLKNSLNYVDSVVSDMVDLDLKFPLIQLLMGMINNVAKMNFGDESALNFLSDAINICVPYGFLDEALLFLNKTSKSSGLNAIQQSQIYKQLANLYRGYRDYNKSLEYINKAFELVKNIQDCDQEYKFSLYLEKGELYTNLKKFDEAGLFLKTALNLARQCYDEPHVCLGDVYLAFGRWANILQKYDDAEQILHKAMYNYRGNPSVGVAYDELSICYCDMGNCKKSLEYGFYSLGFWKRLYGEKHTVTIDAYKRLGMILASCSEVFCDKEVQIAIQKKLNVNNGLDGAEFCFKKSLDLSREIFKTDNDSTASLLNDLAYVSTEKKEYELAIDMYKECIKIRRELFGESYYRLASPYVDMALSYISVGNYELAEAGYVKALDICEKNSEYDEAFVLSDKAIIYESLAELYIKKNDLKKALSYYEYAYNSYCILYGKHSVEAKEIKKKIKQLR